MKPILPIIVTSYEGLTSCLKNQIKIIYLPSDFYEKESQRICTLLSKMRYKTVRIPAQNGVFCAKGLNFRRYFILHHPYY